MPRGRRHQPAIERHHAERAMGLQWLQRLRRSTRRSVVSLLATRSPFPNARADQLSVLAVVDDHGRGLLSTAAARPVLPAAPETGPGAGHEASAHKLSAGRVLLLGSAQLLVRPITPE